MSLRDEPDLDPDVEAAFRRAMNSGDDLSTAIIQADNLDVHAVLTEPTVVTAEFMAELAALPSASPALQAYAELVRDGRCRWDEIEVFAYPLPPEVVELKASTQFIWQWGTRAPTPPPAPVDPPPRPGEKVGGPSDWPDDFEEYPQPRSWLE